MNRAAFFEAAGELSSWIATLSDVTDAELRVAEDLLCRKRRLLRGDVPDEAILLIALGVISGHIEEVMKAFDVVCQAAGWAPRFAKGKRRKAKVKPAECVFPFSFYPFSLKEKSHDRTHP